MIDREMRIKRAMDFFMEGYNCSQSVVLAFADMYGLERDVALRLSSSFGAGMGRMRLTCGAVTGLFMLVGLETGATDPADREGKGRNYAEVQKVAERFKALKGSITCSELLKLRADAPTPHMPDARTAEYYKTRPCVEMVRTAATLFCDFLEENGK